MKHTQSRFVVIVGFLLAGLLSQAPVALSQTAGSDPPEEIVAPDAVELLGEDQEPELAAPDIDDPYEAYRAGYYDRALQGFVDVQVERPEDPELELNLGAVHYQMKDYDRAARAFSSAALAGEPELRAQALYNLGNVAFRQGRLEEAIQAYQAALELSPQDEDAKFNLEFVRDEIRRRHEEAQKRQQENQQQQPQEGEQQEQQEQQEPQEQGAENQPQPEPQASPDQDQDGLSDQQERSAENPTDPQNPDSDQDGLEDGEEDRNRNGKVDSGETDPNQPDSDGDGIGDGEENEATPQPAQSQPAEGEAQEMTPEEAQRYLQSLQEGRARPEHRGRRGRRVRPEKDW